MNRHQASNVARIAWMGLLACCACVERSEVITVARDGSVIIELEYEGTEQELSQGDAMPSAASGWDVTRSVKEDDDEVKHILTTKRRFAPGELLPSSFASPDDPDADLYLSFPTSLRVEQRRDGTYYYFHRTYTPRPWAYVRHWEDMGFDDHIKKLGEKPVEELTLGDRVQIALAFAGFEGFKQIEFAAAAAGESNLDIPIEHWLIARRALMSVYVKEMEVFEKGGVYSGPIVEIIEFCEQLPEPKQGECYDQEAERMLAAAYEAYIQSLRRDAGLSDAQVARFQQAYERAERYYEISDSLGGHSFEIAVRMPGMIVAHNALDDNVEQLDGMSSIRFQFDGKWFRDRAFEMIVVSRVEGRSRAGWKDRVHDGDR
jgi:hypothetical protein